MWDGSREEERTRTYFIISNRDGVRRAVLIHYICAYTYHTHKTRCPTKAKCSQGLHFTLHASRTMFREWYGFCSFVIAFDEIRRQKDTLDDGFFILTHRTCIRTYVNTYVSRYPNAVCVGEWSNPHLIGNPSQWVIHIVSYLREWLIPPSFTRIEGMELFRSFAHSFIYLNSSWMMWIRSRVWIENLEALSYIYVSKGTHPTPLRRRIRTDTFSRCIYPSVYGQ